jgi:chromosome partitioning protein
LENQRYSPNHHETTKSKLEGAMSAEDSRSVRPVRVIVVANEKGGSGKSTVAMHVAIALIRRGQRVATIDLDSRQKTFTHYVENRRAWVARMARDLQNPDHFRLDAASADAPDQATACAALTGLLDDLSQTYDFAVIDTPGHDSPLMRLAHTMADTLITPLNDSFVDLDVLGNLDPDTLGVTAVSHYAETVEQARVQRVTSGQTPTDWVVLRNRLSMTASHNKRLVSAGLEELSRRLGFRCIEGLAERVVFREFFLRGLTALDELDEATLGKRPTLSHVTARQEVDALLEALNLGGLMQGELPAEPKRDAA